MIDGLVHDLKLDKKDETVISLNCIFSRTLFEIEKTGLDMGRSREYGAEFSRDSYGKIKVLVENAKAVLQEPIPEVERVIEMAEELMEQSMKTTVKIPLKGLPTFYSDDEWIWVLNSSKKKIKLFKLKSLRGALIEVLKDGLLHVKGSVYESLREKIGELSNGTQIDNAMREINRGLGDINMPHLSLIKSGNKFQLVLKKPTEKHTV